MVKSTNSKILNVTNYRRIPPKNKCTLQIRKKIPLQTPEPKDHPHPPSPSTLPTAPLNLFVL